MSFTLHVLVTRPGCQDALTRIRDGRAFIEAVRSRQASEAFEKRVVSGKRANINQLIEEADALIDALRSPPFRTMPEARERVADLIQLVAKMESVVAEEMANWPPLSSSPTMGEVARRLMERGA